MFPEGADKPMHFEITIQPDEGMYRTGKFLFDFVISTGYPYDAPKVKCKTKVCARRRGGGGSVLQRVARVPVVKGGGGSWRQCSVRRTASALAPALAASASTNDPPPAALLPVAAPCCPAPCPLPHARP